MMFQGLAGVEVYMLVMREREEREESRGTAWLNQRMEQGEVN